MHDIKVSNPKFPPMKGVRPFLTAISGYGNVKTFSPILFTFYLSDLESFLSTRQVNGVECDVVQMRPIFILNCLFYCMQMTQFCLVTIAMIYNMP